MEHLHSMCMALDSISNTARKKKRCGNQSFVQQTQTANYKPSTVLGIRKDFGFNSKPEATGEFKVEHMI